jgi:ABC-type branched-subunit amino acid transport system substrate-binding protein
MDPSDTRKNLRRELFFAKYRELYNTEPTIPFHTAGVADTLDLISEYVKTHGDFDEMGFRAFLLGIKHYKDMLGELGFDAEGNTAVGFRLARIERNVVGLP